MTDRKRPERVTPDAPTRRGYLGALAGVAVAGCVDGGGGGEGAEPDDGELELSGFPIRLVEPGTNELITEAQSHPDYGHWHIVPVEIPHNSSLQAEARILDTDNNRVPVGEDEAYRLEIYRTEETAESLVEILIDGTSIEIRGRSKGEGQLVFEIVENATDDPIYTSPLLDIVVL